MVMSEAVKAAAGHLGLSGRAVCVHSSLRSFGRVEGGAATVVGGLLFEGCTVVVPTFSWRAFAVRPSRARPPRNAWDYTSPESGTAGTDRVYTPDTDEIDEDMGAIPTAVLAKAGRVRGNHPLCSFTAAGPLADELIGKQQPLRVWGALEALCEHDGVVVLMGVGLGTMSLLHLAEQRAGRNPFRRWANGPDRNTMEVEAGGCSGGFGNFEPVLAPLESQTEVGTSMWRVFPAQATLDAAARAIRRDPMITHCGDPECGRCRDAAAGGPVLEGSDSQGNGNR
jgi:aminoglycoside 3-N-acetyltransferase